VQRVGRQAGLSMPAQRCRAVAALLPCIGFPALAQPVVAQLQTIELVEARPLPGPDLPRDRAPSNVQTATGDDIDRLHAPDLAN